MSETLQEKNKALLVKGFDVLFNKRDFPEAEKFWSPNYIQHSGEGGAALKRFKRHLDR